MPWDDLILERGAERDRARHEARVREALAQSLGDLVAEEALVGGGETRLRLSYPVLRERRLRFAQEGASQQVAHAGQGSGSGEGAGEANADTELDWLHEEVAEALGRRWRLPALAGPGPHGWQQHERDALQRTGAWANLHRRQSMLAAIRRSQLTGSALRLLPEDLRFRTVRDEQRPGPNVRIIALRDVSGSMGDEKKLLCRSFFHWLATFIRRTYGPLEIAFVVHHTEAQHVQEEEFFRRAESGGTKVSSAYRVGLDLAREASARGQHALLVHFTDGDNWGDADNRLSRELVLQILPLVDLFGYVEVRPHGRTSGLGTTLQDVADPRFRILRVTDRQSVLGALDALFGEDAS